MENRQRTRGHKKATGRADHGATEGGVFGQDAGALGLRPAACPAVRLGALGAQHHPGALVAGHTVPSGQGAAMRRALFLLRVHFLVHRQSSS